MSTRDIPLSLAEAVVRAEIDRGGSPAGEKASPRPPFTITISREVGALGNGVATEIGRRLGWPVYDRDLLDGIVEELRCPPSRVEVIDERPASWLADSVAAFGDKHHVGSDTYFRRLFAAVRDLGKAGRCVIVGRGANFILPAETTLRVRLVAAEKDRARVIAHRLRLSPKEAEARMKAIEADRIAFVKSAFREDPAVPLHYDLTLNMSRLSVSEAADIIVDALLRFESRARAEHAEKAVV